MARARAGIALLTESGISSIMARVSARRGGPGEKTRKRVLVAGQVEDHAFNPVRLSQPHDQQ
nr:MULTISPECIES: hypothetical protein [Sinorhizobium]